MPTRLLNVPEINPRSWFREDPDWYQPGAKLSIWIGAEGEGRACGLIQPPPGASRYMPGTRGPEGRRHRNFGRRPPDSRYYPDGFKVFNRGVVAVLDDDGEPGSIAAGVLPLMGGHAGRHGARNITEAVSFLHREGRWANAAEDLGLVGVASAYDAPGFEGAVMFRGAALPGMTVREAIQVNGTSFSAEVWEDPTYNNDFVFAGAIRCEHTAWPNHLQPESLAAEIDEEDCVGPFCVVFSSTGNEIAAEAQPDEEPNPTTEEEPTVEEPEAVGCGRACVSCKRDTPTEVTVPPDPEPAPEPEPASIEAEGDLLTADITSMQAALTAVTSTVEELVQRFDEFEEKVGAEVAELSMTLFAGEGLGVANELLGLRSEVADLALELKELKDERANTPQRPDVETDDKPKPLGAPASTIPNPLAA